MLLLEQLTGQQEESEVFELFGSEEPQPMEKPSIKSQLLSGLVAQLDVKIYSTNSKKLIHFFKHDSLKKFTCFTEFS